MYMYAITSNPIDLAFCALLVVSVVLYVAAQFYRDRHNVQFSSMRQMFDALEETNGRFDPEGEFMPFGDTVKDEACNCATDDTAHYPGCNIWW